MIRLLILSAFLMFSFSCKSSSERESINEVNLEYEFELRGCSTGKQTFSSVDQLCQGVLNDLLNNGCAPALRADYYNRNCQETAGFEPIDITDGISSTQTDDFDSDSTSITTNSSTTTNSSSTSRPSQFDLVTFEGEGEFSYTDPFQISNNPPVFASILSLRVDRWDSQTPSDFDDSIVLDAENAITLSSSNYCDVTSAGGGIKSSGSSIIQLNLRGGETCLSYIQLQQQVADPISLKGSSLTTLNGSDVNSILIKVTK